MLIKCIELCNSTSHPLPWTGSALYPSMLVTQGSICLNPCVYFSCNCALYREALPLVGALISNLLVCAEKEKLRKLQLSALNCLSVLLDPRQGQTQINICRAISLSSLCLTSAPCSLRRWTQETDWTDNSKFSTRSYDNSHEDNMQSEAEQSSNAGMFCVYH